MLEGFVCEALPCGNYDRFSEPCLANLSLESTGGEAMAFCKWWEQTVLLTSEHIGSPLSLLTDWGGKPFSVYYEGRWGSLDTYKPEALLRSHTTPAVSLATSSWNIHRPLRQVSIAAGRGKASDMVGNVWGVD